MNIFDKLVRRILVADKDVAKLSASESKSRIKSGIDSNDMPFIPNKQKTRPMYKTGYLYKHIIQKDNTVTAPWYGAATLNYGTAKIARRQFITNYKTKSFNLVMERYMEQLHNSL